MDTQRNSMTNRPQLSQEYGITQNLSVESVAPTYQGGEETFIWAGLALVIAKSQRSPTALITLVHLIVRLFLFPKREENATNDRIFKRITSRKGDSNGVAASIVLVPVLLETLRQSSSDDDTTNWWGSLAQTTSATLPFLLETNETLKLILGAVAFFGAYRGRSLLFVALWWTLYASVHWTKSLHRVFTKGEWIISTSLLAVSLTRLFNYPAVEDAEYMHCLVSLSLLFASGIMFTTIDVAVGSSKSTWIRLLFCATVTLSSVETLMWIHAPAVISRYNYVPRSAFWLLDFLLQTEEPMLVSPFIPSAPRFQWLLYWIVVVSITVPMAPFDTQRVVLTRKWFHFIAVLLFAPVTLSSPQLMSMSYAIAGTLLVTTECVRPYNLFIDSFFARYLDRRKGEGADGTTVISHLALILGCAAPLWVSECVTVHEDADNPFHQTTLALWGVLSLGVGDAMGAVVGSTLGRMQWGFGRTVEGSLAMMGSITVACYCLSLLLVDARLDRFTFGAIVAATLLEAFTLQLDNLILPLAGSIVLLLAGGTVGD